MEVKHGGCINCESVLEEFLMAKHVIFIDLKGKETFQSVALCSVCFSMTTVDLRIRYDQTHAKPSTRSSDETRN